MQLDTTLFKVSFVLSLLIGCIDSNPPKSGQNFSLKADSPDHDVRESEIATKLGALFESLETNINTMRLSEVDEQVGNIMSMYNTLRDRDYLEYFAGLSRMMGYTSFLIARFKSKQCDTIDYMDRLDASSIKRYQEYNNLSAFIVKLNRQHAQYCFRKLQSNLFNAIQFQMMPSNRMLENMKIFLDFWDKTSSSVTNRNQKRDKNNTLMVVQDVSTLMDVFLNFLEGKYSLKFEPSDNSLLKHKVRFIKQMDKFMDEDEDAFCGPILRTLDNSVTNMYDELVYLIRIDPQLATNLDKTYFQWFSALLICKQIKQIRVVDLYHRYIETRFEIGDLEKRLLDQRIGSSDLASTRETYLWLSILREKYSDSLRLEHKIKNIDELLEIKFIDEEKCTTKKLMPLVELKKSYRDIPRIELYLKSNLEKQLTLCLANLQAVISEAFHKIDIVKRNKVTNLRHKVEASLSSYQQTNGPRENELWQLTGQRKDALFNEGMVDYVRSTIGNKSKSVQELREKVDTRLKAACQEVKNVLQQCYEQFACYLGTQLEFNDVTHSWMSAYNLCDYYIRDMFNWTEIFDKSKSSTANHKFGAFSSQVGNFIKKKLDQSK